MDREALKQIERQLTDLVVVKYQNSNKKYVFKVPKKLDTTIDVGDLLVVHTGTYEVVTVVKVLKKDLNDLEYLTNALKATKYIVNKVDTTVYNDIVLTEVRAKTLNKLMGDYDESNTKSN